MYKKVAISTILFIFAVCFFFYKWMQYDNLFEELTNSAILQKRAENIKKNAPQLYKSIDKLNRISSNIDENYLKGIMKLSELSKEKIINNQDYEFVLTAKNEKDIITDLQSLYFQTEGLLQFGDIKLKRESNLIKAKIICRFTLIDTSKILEYVKISPLKIPSVTTELFKIPRTHVLLATMNNQQAFIDNKWHSTGELIDENLYITKIGQYTVETQKGEKISTIHIGEKWQ